MGSGLSNQGPSVTESKHLGPESVLTKNQVNWVANSCKLPQELLNSTNSVCTGLGIACLSIGLVIRLLVTFLLVHFGGFNLKEKLFIAVAWLPKATVQVCVCVYHRRQPLDPPY